MRIPIVRVGNSRGIRIPKAIIEQCQFGEEVNLEVRNQKVVISPVTPTRAGWSEAFQKLGDPGAIEDNGFSNEWDAQEWEWK
jgi:antitoxin MazE